jgi:hypothetical protein
MPAIPVPRPKSSINPQRAMNTLLQAQVHHLQQAEQHLPTKYRSEIYTHAIHTEGEAAEYIREVTEAIHQAHLDAVRTRSKKKRPGTKPSRQRRAHKTGPGTRRKRLPKQRRRV